MIDPKLQDGWTRDKLTEINYQDSSVNGAGVSLTVLLPALKELDLSWYSTVYGDYDDNILLLVFDNETATAVEKIPYVEPSPVETVCGETFPQEYVLTEVVRSILGIKFKGNSYEIEQETHVICQAYIHDNCFFYINPVDDKLLDKVLQCIFAQHSFYLGHAVDWTPVSQQITEQLLKLGQIKMQSDREKQCMWIPQLEKKRSIFSKKPKQGTVVITNGRASFRDIEGLEGE